MLASPVSPSISLGSHTHSSHSSHNSRSSSIGGTSSPNGTYASPKHPAYLPSSSNNNNDNNARSPSQHSITSSSTGGANGNNSTSNYSKYTTHSQIERVNDVLVDKVLHAPIPLSFNQQRQPYYSQDNEEQGSALRRLTAFLDGEEDNVALSNAPIAGSSSREQPTMQVKVALLKTEMTDQVLPGKLSKN